MPDNRYDATDRAILDVLQVDGRIANNELADRVGLSPSACLRRVKAMEADGVIAGYRAVVDPAAVGLGLRVYVLLRVDQHSRGRAQQIEAALTAIPEVVACHMVSGEADFMVEVLISGLHDYEKILLDKILVEVPISDARSTFALRTAQTAGPVPLDQWVRARSGRRAAPHVEP